MAGRRKRDTRIAAEPGGSAARPAPPKGTWAIPAGQTAELTLDDSDSDRCDRSLDGRGGERTGERGYASTIGLMPVAARVENGEEQTRGARARRCRTHGRHAFY